jgi:hypothetical protein
MAAVDEKVKEKTSILESELEAEIVVFVSEMETKVDKYLTYTAEEWLKENEVEIETGIKIEISENLINGLKGIFEDSYVEVPESKINLVKEAEETIDSLLSSIDENKVKIDELQVELNSIKSSKIVDEAAKEMTDTQKEKLGTLIESIEYTDDKEYKNKIQVVIENYFNQKPEDINEDVKVPKSSVMNERMEMYKKHLKKKD